METLTCAWNSKQNEGWEQALRIILWGIEKFNVKTQERATKYINYWNLWYLSTFLPSEH